MISIVDYGMGNVGSILNMIRRAGGTAEVISDPDLVARAEKLILPGVGAFDTGMSRLHQTGLQAALNRAVLERQAPILGICLGVQLFSRKSEEGRSPGLGWINADTVRFRFHSESAQLKLPHMGWNRMQVLRPDRLLSDLPNDPRFYFVHTYHLACDSDDDAIGRTTYGHAFVSAIRYKNIWGTQFHPEKSHKYGLSMIRNFIELV